MTMSRRQVSWAIWHARPAATVWHFRAIAALLALTFLTGGGSYGRGLGDVIAQLAAIPVLAWCLWTIAQSPFDRRRAWVLAVAGLVPLVVALQLLPLPASIWQGNGARGALLQDLTIAGVSTSGLRWSMTPGATERGLWSLLPALAVFVGALLLDAAQRRRMLLLVIGLVMASLLLGYLQLGAPQDSLLNPFPEWAPALNGVFANPNHQATAIAVALVLLLGLLPQPRSGRGDAAARPRAPLLAMVLSGVLLLGSLPLTGSRAIIPLALLGLVAVPLLDGGIARWLPVTRLPRPMPWILLGLAVVSVAAVLIASLQWVKVDADHESRGALARATAAMGSQLAPWGGGVGSFVPWFDQGAPDRLIGNDYFNHAHNEYVQWWLESGVAGMLALAAVLALLAWAPPWSSHGGQADSAAVGSWVAVLLVLGHSAVDYPLRTPSMMCVTALLAGIAVAAALARPPMAGGTENLS